MRKILDPLFLSIIGFNKPKNHLALLSLSTVTEEGRGLCMSMQCMQCYTVAVLESYQKNGAVSNQLKDVERGVGVLGCEPHIGE